MVKVLCIDNSETIRKIVQDCVEDLGFEFFESENGKKGIEYAESIDGLDMIIFDWNMPVLNGKDFLIKLKNNKKTKKIITFVLINLAEKQKALEALELGANMYLLKPFSVNNLQETIEEIIKNAV